MDKKLPGSLQGRTNIARCLHTWIPFWHTELNCLSKIAPQFFLHYSFLVFSMRTNFFFFFDWKQSFLSWHSEQKGLQEGGACPDRQRGGMASGGRSPGLGEAAIVGLEPGTDPQGCSMTRTGPCSHCPESSSPVLASTMTSPFKTSFLFYKYTYIKLGRGISAPSFKWGPYFSGSKNILPPPLAGWVFSAFYKAVADIAIKVLKHRGALPSFTICLLLRESI